MTEAPVLQGTHPEIDDMRAWIEGEVIGQGTCPPLVKLAQNYKIDGSIDWDHLSDEVDIRTYRHLNQGGSLLTASVANDYFNYIAKETQGISPMTQVFVLPDFNSNEKYNQFIDEVKKTVTKKLRSTKEGIEIARKAYVKAANLQNRPTLQTLTILNLGHRRHGIVVDEVMEGLYDPVIFYGNPLADRDIVDFGSARGDNNRQKVLSRAPYFSFQLVSAFRGLELSERLNINRLYARNTLIATSKDFTLFEKKIRAYRK